MKKIEKIDNVHEMKFHENTPNMSQNDLGFMLWKAELSKELLSFWKSMQK